MTVIKTPYGPLVVEPVDEGWGSIEWLIGERVHPGVRHSVARILVRPGAESPRERHAQATETAILLSGEITCVIDGRPVELWPGDVALIPAGAHHYLRNESREPATVLLSFSAGAAAG
ncbi:MAG: cupin domain-containing protein [Alphaproteobacteria bacterium]|nr:cupin domain-containing protein [Alphaproteobacteria bacterium]MCW5740948.1 cupin domain-containing protein [Alphaproteobacteria bacterium]